MLITAALAAPLSDIVDLVASRDEACALDGSGGLWCWGDSAPEAIKRSEQVVAVASPGCWLHRDGRLSCAGLQSQPFPPGTVSLVQGNGWVCALGADGLVRCAGDWAEALGGPHGVDRNVPTTLPEIEGAVELSASGCVRKEDGQVTCATRRGPLRVEGVSAVALMDTLLGSYLIGTDRTVWKIPRLGKVALNASSFATGYGGWPRTCKTDVGRLWCGSDDDPTRPISLATGGPFATDGPVVLGRGFGCALGIDRTVACWGPATVRWWGQRAAVPWPAITDPPEPKLLTSFQEGSLARCALADRQVRCEPPSPFGSLTAPDLALDDIDTLVVGSSQSCATRGSVLLCFGRLWLGYSDAGPGVVAFSDVADFAMDDFELVIVGTDGRVRRFVEGREEGTFDLDAVHVALGRDVACVQTRDARALCWSLAWLDEPALLGLPPEVRVEKLRVEGQSVCVAGTQWCADNEPPLQDRALVIEVAP